VASAGGCRGAQRASQVLRAVKRQRGFAPAPQFDPPNSQGGRQRTRAFDTWRWHLLKPTTFHTMGVMASTRTYRTRHNTGLRVHGRWTQRGPRTHAIQHQCLSSDRLARDDHGVTTTTAKTHLAAAEPTAGARRAGRVTMGQSNMALASIEVWSLVESSRTSCVGSQAQCGAGRVSRTSDLVRMMLLSHVPIAVGAGALSAHSTVERSFALCRCTAQCVHSPQPSKWMDRGYGR
jgi:hypothetical protein